MRLGHIAKHKRKDESILKKLKLVVWKALNDSPIIDFRM